MTSSPGSPRGTVVMLFLELIAIEAARLPDDSRGRPPHALGTVAWAWMEQDLGLSFLADDIAGAGGRDACLERLNEAIKYRPRRLMNAEARGLVLAIETLADLGILNERVYHAVRGGEGMVTGIYRFEAVELLEQLRGKPGHGVQLFVQKLCEGLK